MRWGVAVLIVATGWPVWGGCRVGRIDCDWSIALESITWYQPDGEDGISRNEQSLELGLHTDPDRRWQFVTDLQLVAGSKVPRVDLMGTGVEEFDDQWEVRSDAAYLELFGLLEGLDVRVGRQIVAWGAADVFNPTDVLSSKSYENPADFGANLPNPSVDVRYYRYGFTLNLLYVHKFQSPRLPPDLEQQFFSSNRIPAEFQDLAEQFLAADGNIDVTLNARVPSESMWGARLSRNIGGYDVSLSYARARENLPVLGTLDVTAFDPVAFDATVEAELLFPEKTVVGVDFTGQLPFWGNPGIWAEAAWHEPEPLARSVTLVGQTLSEEELTGGYLKYTVGGDYTFRDGTLLQGQLVHGFIDENEEELIETYVVMGAERSFFTDSVKVRLFEAYSLDDGSLLVNPDIRWQATDRVEVGLGGILYAGDISSKFGSIPTGDEYFVRLRYGF